MTPTLQITQGDAQKEPRLHYGFYPRRFSRARAVLKQLALEFGVKVHMILGQTRGVERVARARQVAAFILRDKFDWSFPAISRALRRKCHNTAQKAYWKIADWKARYPVTIGLRIKRIESALGISQ